MTREISWILENKRHLCLLAAAYICGILLYFRPQKVWPALLFLTGGGTALVLVFYEKRREAAVTAILAAALFLLAFFRCAVQDQTYERRLEYARSQTETELTGIVCKKEIKANSYLYYLKTNHFKNSGEKRETQQDYGKILVYGSEDSAAIGSVITVTGEVDLFPHAVNEGNFDLADYYKSQNITFRMFSDHIRIRRQARWNFREMLYQLQKRISEVYETELNDRDAGILGTLALGNQAMMEDEIEEMYQGAGISHILAISGLHISILGYGLFGFLRKCGCSYPLAAGAGSGVVFAFALMSGMAVSARRAFLMYLLMMGAQVIGRSYDSVNGLALAALLVLILNPQALFQSGFQFSFLSIAGLQAASAVTGKRREEAELRRQEKLQSLKEGAKPQRKGGFFSHIQKWRKSFQENLLSGAVLQLFLLPLTAWHYYETPLYSLFLNLLVIPLCSWLLGFGLLGGVAGIFLPELSKWLLIVCHGILTVYEMSIGAVDLLPFSRVITGKPGAWVMLGYYIFLLWGCVQVIRGERSVFFRWRTGGKGGRLLRGYAGLLCPTVLLGMILFCPEKQFCRIDFLDVSQGDGIYLTDGEGTHLMIDGGSTDEKQVGKYRIQPFLKYHGVKKIDAWIITHGDEDHCSGALELLQSGYPVDYLVLAQAMPEDEARSTLTEAARQNGTEVILARAGDSLMWKGGDLTCLYPQQGEEGGDANGLSQVWSLKQEGLSVLFTGDIGTDAEEKMESRGLLGKYTILKAAHHGSKTSSGERFLEIVSPQYTVISYGKDNFYGHPHRETIKRLEDAGSRILRTEEKGQITVYRSKKGWGIRFFSPSVDDENG